MPATDLPEVLVREDGSPVESPQAWQSRARELHLLFGDNVYGAPPGAASEVRASVVDEGVADFGVAARLSKTTFIIGGTLRAELLEAVPPGKRPVPYFVGLNFSGAGAVLDSARSLAGVAQPALSQAAWPLGEIVSRGYGLATFRAADLVPDSSVEALSVLRLLRSAQAAERAPGDPGALSSWAWGISRVVDYLAERPGVDPSRIAVFGHSRMGKAALLAGARDDRLRMVVASQSGCGGSAPWRVPERLRPPTAGSMAAETLESITSRFGYWFCDGLARFRDDPGALPVEQHELIALCAPRPVLLTNATEDHWSYPAGQREMLEAAAPVYRLLCGLDDTVIAPPPEEGVLAPERLGWFVRAGGHSTTLDDWRAWLDYADRWL